jgi:type I restriction enzyme, S subunit
MTARITRTGGRPAIEGVIRGRYALSVGNPGDPVASGWEWAPLSSLARLESGHTPSRKHPEYWGGDIPWIGIRDATSNHGRTLVDTAQHINDLGIANSSARLLPTNTVCLSRTASVGYVVVMGRPMATSQDFVNWVCSDDLDYRFLMYVLLAEHDTHLPQLRQRHDASNDLLPRGQGLPRVSAPVGCPATDRRCPRFD